MVYGQTTLRKHLLPIGLKPIVAAFNAEKGEKLLGWLSGPDKFRKHESTVQGQEPLATLQRFARTSDSARRTDAHDEIEWLALVFLQRALHEVDVANK
jgi:hypothetical protein